MQHIIFRFLLPFSALYFNILGSSGGAHVQASFFAGRCALRQDDTLCRTGETWPKEGADRKD